MWKLKAYFIYFAILASAVAVNLIGFKLRKQQWNFRRGLIPFIVVLGVSALLLTNNPWFEDFETAYYAAGRAVLDDVTRLYTNPCVFGFVNMPVVALACVPFAVGGLSTGIVLFTLAGTLCIIAAFRLLIRSYPATSERVLAVAGLFFINGPMYNSLREGNSTHFVLVCLVLGLTFASRNKSYGSGALLGLAAILKPPVALFAPYFLVRAKWRELAGMISAIVILMAISFLAFGIEPHLQWVNQCLFPYAGKPLAAFNSQSLDAYLARIFYPGHYLSWEPVSVDPWFGVLRSILIVSLVGFVVFYVLRCGPLVSKQQSEIEYSIVLTMSVLFFPISWSHYYLWLLIPVGLVTLGRLQIPSGKGWLSLAIAGSFLVSLPVIGIFPPSPFLNLPPVMHAVELTVLSHYFLGGCLLLVLLLKMRKTAVEDAGEGAGHS